jgi:hypothetical protein
MPAYVQGAAIPLNLYAVTDPSGAVVASPTSVTIKIVRADGTAISFTSNWHNDSNGNFWYYYASSTSDPVGRYNVEWDIVSSGCTITKQDAFDVVPALA